MLRRPVDLVPLHRAAAIAIVAGGATLAALWAAAVPVFQSPDEDTHYDYLISIATAGRLLTVGDRPGAEINAVSPFAPYAHPHTWHLAIHTHALQIRFRQSEKVPAGYGTAAFWDRLDATAPSDSPWRNPWLLPRLPAGYYALGAAWVAALGGLAAGPAGTFFLARSFSVLLLVVALAASYTTLRRLERPGIALALLAGLAFLPLTSFVGSYVQPDNLALAATMLCCWFALRLRDRPSGGVRRRDLVALGLALGLLVTTRYHFFAVVAVPVFALAAVRLAAERRPRWLTASATLLAPSLGLLGLQLVLEGGRPEWPARVLGLARTTVAFSGAPQEAGPELLHRLADGAHLYFGGGQAFRTFWQIFGWNDRPLTVRDPATTEALIRLLVGCTVFALILIGTRLFRTWVRLARLGQRGRGGRAVRLLVANPLLNAYLLFSATMLLIYIALGNFGLQGRHWYALVPGILWAGTCYAPRALPRRWARLARLALLAGLLLYDAAAGRAAWAAIWARYYDEATLAGGRPTLVLPLGAATYDAGPRL